MTPDPAAALVARLAARGWSLGVAESLTGGLVQAAIVAVPGASVVFRGGVTAYDTRVKHALLGVDAEVLRARGAVDPDVAVQMASGVRRAMTLEGVPADVGVATTGVAGPGPADGHPAGTVYVAVDADGETRVRGFAFDGDRAEVRARATEAALELVCEAVGVGPEYDV